MLRPKKERRAMTIMESAPAVAPGPQPPPPAEDGKTELVEKLTADQVSSLTAAFAAGQMPDAAKRLELAKDLGLTPRCVHLWFQTRRQRWRTSSMQEALYCSLDRNGLKAPSSGMQAPKPKLAAGGGSSSSRSASASSACGSSGSSSLASIGRVSHPAPAGPAAPVAPAAPAAMKPPTAVWKPVQWACNKKPSPKPRWHHTLLKSGEDFKIATPVPCLLPTPDHLAARVAELGPKYASKEGRKRPDPASGTSSGDGSPAANSDEHEGEEGNRKRARILNRTKITKDQVAILAAAFVANPMPDTCKRQLLAHHLGLTPRCVHVWFQNRRQRLKVKDPKAPLPGGQFEWCSMLAAKEGKNADEPQIEAEPALRALAGMHKASKRSRGTPAHRAIRVPGDNSAAAPGCSTEMDLQEEEEDEIDEDEEEEEEGDGGEKEEEGDGGEKQEEKNGEEEKEKEKEKEEEEEAAPIAEAFVHSSSMDLSGGVDNYGLEMLLAGATKCM